MQKQVNKEFKAEKEGVELNKPNHAQNDTKTDLYQT